MISLCPITISDAKVFCAEHHRRHKKPPVSGLWAVGIARDGDVVGVAIVGRPVARGLQDGWTCEVTRVTVLEGVKNGCSMLYGAAWRAARSLGYRRCITYTGTNEPGTSLRAAIIDAVGPSKRTRRIPVHLIPAEVRAVCRRFRVTSEDVFSRGRGRPAVCDARAVAMWLMYGPGASYHDVGAAFGRDHSTVVGAVQKVERNVALLSVAREVQASLVRKEAA